MIDWEETERQLGFTAKSRIPKTTKICCRCDSCGALVMATKQRHYQYIHRAGVFRCKNCGKKANKINLSARIKEKWKDPEYKVKQKARKHSDDLKKEARERSLRLWNDRDYIDKYKKGFDPEVAVANLNKSSKANQVKGLKKYWNNESNRENRSKLSIRLWSDDDYRNKVIAGLKKYYSSSAVLATCSERSKKLWENEDYKNNWLISFLESMTDKRRDQISVQSAKNWCNKQYREKIESHWDSSKRKWMSEICKSWWTDENKDRISKKMIEMWSDDEQREKFIDAFNKAWTEERRQRAREWWTEDRRQEASERVRKLWENPDFVQKMLAMCNKPSSLEIQFSKLLDDYDAEYNQQVHIGPYLFDFELKDGTLIEIQGDYWHTLPKTIIKDKAKATYIERYFPHKKLLYLWEHEFYELNKIKSFVESLIKKPRIIKFLISDLKFDDAVDYQEAKELIEKYHYKGSLNRSGMICGARLNNKLIAASVFASPTRNVTGGELIRFVIDPLYQKKNLGSWLLSRSTKKALEKWDKVFTFADPNFNHRGTLYLASNWTYDGEAKPDYWYVSKSGWIMHKKTLWNRAKNLCKSEKEYAQIFEYTKVWGLPKKKYFKT